MSGFHFNAKASLQRAREGQTLPIRPNRPNREQVLGQGLGGLGRLGTGAGENQTAPDPDGIARAPEAISAIWDAAEDRAQDYRRTNKPPTCTVCGESDWAVSLTEPDGRKLHVACWKEQSQ